MPMKTFLAFLGNLAATAGPLLSFVSYRQRKEESQYIGEYGEKMKRFYMNVYRKLFENLPKLEFLQKLHIMWERHEKHQGGFWYKGCGGDVEDGGTGNVFGGIDAGLVKKSN